jgi:hypothetical protein
MGRFEIRNHGPNSNNCVSLPKQMASCCGVTNSGVLLKLDPSVLNLEVDVPCTVTLRLTCSRWLFNRPCPLFAFLNCLLPQPSTIVTASMRSNLQDFHNIGMVALAHNIRRRVPPLGSNRRAPNRKRGGSTGPQLQDNI